MLTAVLLGLSTAVIVTALAYNTGMFVLSRRVVRPTATDDPHRRRYVFLLACLNEERVLAESLRRLMSLPRQDVLVLVVDDASDDRTAEIVRAADPSRVLLHQRHLPNARRGKGAALNDGLRHLGSSGLLAGTDPEDVVVCVLDADGRLEPGAVDQADRFFDDPATGAVQIGVRMYNREDRLLCRMQDMEFVVYTDVFQSGRRHIGSVGMGGNGQFMRLSALRSLGPEPWSDRLTEDLDLGIRLLAAGWRNEYCATAAVHQQAVLAVRPLVRQRSRWFQGHIQATRLVPMVLREIPGRAAADLVYHLSSPALLLLTSLLPLAFLAGAVGFLTDSLAAGHSTFSPYWLIPLYLLAFAPAYAYAHVYRQREGELGWWRCLLLAHLFVGYGYLWFAAGWWAVGRTVRGRTGWLKTART
ncbi:glycosyltransferase family 2 protein [Kitasatospora sp. NPDC001664]|uniref:glycosyltransferase family 2 protein n=1 Tax=Kitasatospora albolonga TaxID=68173 RepID=UPI0031ED2A0F